MPLKLNSVQDNSEFHSVKYGDCDRTPGLPGGRVGGGGLLGEHAHQPVDLAGGHHRMQQEGFRDNRGQIRASRRLQEPHPFACHEGSTA